MKITLPEGLENLGLTKMVEKGALDGVSLGVHKAVNDFVRMASPGLVTSRMYMLDRLGYVSQPSEVLMRYFAYGRDWRPNDRDDTRFRRMVGIAEKILGDVFMGQLQLPMTAEIVGERLRAAKLWIGGGQGAVQVEMPVETDAQLVGAVLDFIAIMSITPSTLAAEDK